MRMKNIVLTVSDYILRYAKEKGKGLSVMQLMDYLYFVQAQVLVVKNRPAFPEALIAKDWGIFVQDVWNKYSWYGNAFIPVSDKLKNSIPDADLIEEVVDALDGKSHTAIFGIIRQQAPYKNGLQNILVCEIQNKDLRDFFCDSTT